MNEKYEYIQMIGAFCCIGEGAQPPNLAGPPVEFDILQKNKGQSYQSKVRILAIRVSWNFVLYLTMQMLKIVNAYYNRSTRFPFLMTKLSALWKEFFIILIVFLW